MFDPPSHHDTASNRPLSVALRLFAFLLLAAHLAASLLSEDAAWGLWPYTYLPVWLRWPLTMALMGWIAIDATPGDRLLTIKKAAEWLLAFTFAHPFFTSSLALPIFYLGRIVHTRWGDAYILTFGIPHPEVWLTYTWQAPLDLYLHAKLWLLGHRLWGWPDAMPVYWLLSSLAGVLFLFTLFRLADLVGRDTTEKCLAFGLVASLGLLQFFFGYIENYVLMAAAMLVYFTLAVRCLRREGSLLAPAAALALCHALHPSSLILLPSLGMLAWQRKSDGLATLLKSVALPYALIGGGTVALMTAGGHGLETLFTNDRPGGGDARWFVPIFQTTTRWEHYTMFSWLHLRDILNEQLLVAPVTLPSLVLIALFARAQVRTVWCASAEVRFFAIASLPYLLLTFVWNPDYGGRRDWDLFAPAYLPATLLLAYLLPRALSHRGALARAGSALVATSMVHTIAWIVSNTRPWEWPTR